MLSGEELKQLIWFCSLSMAEQRRLAPSSMTQTTTSASSAEGFYAATRAGRKKLTAVLEPETHKHSGCWLSSSAKTAKLCLARLSTTCSGNTASRPSPEE